MDGKVSDLLNDIRSIEISNLPKLPIRIDPLDSLLDYLPDEKNGERLGNIEINWKLHIYWRI